MYLRTGTPLTIITALLVHLIISPPNLFAQRAAAQPASAQDVAARALPALVLVVCTNGSQTSRASGFFVKPGVLVTNRHVIEGMDRGYVQTTLASRMIQRRFQIAEVLTTDDESDLALLSVPAAKTAGLVLPLSPTAPPVGAGIFALGNPQGLTGTISSGIVSAAPRSSGPSSRIQITAPISEGSSGGPVVNARAEVVGVVQGSMADGQNLNFAVPSNLVIWLLKKTKMPVTQISKALVAKSGGKWIGAVPRESGDASEKAPQERPSVIGPVRPGESAARASLRKLQGVGVLVENLDEDGKDLFTEERIQSTIELRLRRNRIRVLTEAEQIASPGMPHLYLRVSVLKTNSGQYSYFCSLSLKQTAYLDRDREFFAMPATWEKSTMGFDADRTVANEIIELVEGLVDQFSNDYLAAQ